MSHAIDVTAHGYKLEVTVHNYIVVYLVRLLNTEAIQLLVIKVAVIPFLYALV